MRTITIVNQSTVVSAADFQAAVAALQKQLDEHVAPAWGGLTAQLVAVQGQPGAPQAPSGETIYVLDNSDQQGALGYHELTNLDSPVGYAFAKTCLDDNTTWQSCLSHELIEQLIDPFVDAAVIVDAFPLTVRGQVRNVPAAVSYEACDPVENDSYDIDGVPVSNFVLPAWFQSVDTPGVHGPYDYLGKLTSPLSMTSGGYIAYTRNMRQWQQVVADRKSPAEKYARHGKPKRGANRVHGFLGGWHFPGVGMPPISIGIGQPSVPPVSTAPLPSTTIAPATPPATPSPAVQEALQQVHSDRLAVWQAEQALHSATTLQAQQQAEASLTAAQTKLQTDGQALRQLLATLYGSAAA